MPLGGPVEFSPAEIAVVLLVVLAMSLVVPVGAGLLAAHLYRRRTPIEARERSAALRTFLLWAAIAFVGQYVLLWLGNMFV